MGLCIKCKLLVKIIKGYCKISRIIIYTNVFVLPLSIPEPVVLSHTPNPDASNYYELKGSVLTSRTDAVNAYKDIITSMRKEKEDALMADKNTRKEAIKEYKNFCEMMLLKKDPNVNDYTICYEEEESE